MPGIRVPPDPPPLEVRRLQGKIHLHDIRAGCILWLPKKDDIHQDLLTGFDIDDGCFNHPIVVLSTEPSERKATVLVLTSFNGQDLAEKFPENHHLRARHLPISPSAAHPDNDIILFLDGTTQLRKKTYVKTDVKIIPNVKCLIPYCHSGKEYKLSQESFDVLAEYINFVPPTRDLYVPTTLHPSLRTPATAPSYPPPISRPVLRETQYVPPQPPSVPSHRPIQPITFYYPRLDPTSRRDRRAEPLPSDPLLPNRRSTSAPEPDSPSFADYIIPLLLLASLGGAAYGGYRLFLLGKWLVEEMGRKWADFSAAAVLTRFMHWGGATGKRLVRHGYSWGLGLLKRAMGKVGM